MIATVRAEEVPSPRRRTTAAIQGATMPFPGFPTDLQPFVIALNAVADGVGLLSENLFEARWRFVQEIVATRCQSQHRLGNHALAPGPIRLSGAEVEASRHPRGCGPRVAGRLLAA